MESQVKNNQRIRTKICIYHNPNPYNIKDIFYPISNFDLSLPFEKYCLHEHSVAV